MKTSLINRKTILMLMLLVFALVLSGCNLVVKDPEVDARQIILEVNGETMDKARFTPLFQNAMDNDYNEQARNYQQYGLPTSQIRQDRDQIMSGAMNAAVLDMLLHQKAHELKLDELTEEETAKLEEEAKASYQQILDLIKNIYFQNSELEEEALNAAVEKQAADFGYTLDMFVESTKEGDLHNKLQEYAGKDVTVSEDEVKSEYNRLVEEARTRYEANLNSYSMDVDNQAIIYYTPAGYRYVRQVLVALEETDKTAITALESELGPLNNAVAAAQTAADEYEALLTGSNTSEQDQAFLQEQASALGEDTARYQELIALAELDDAQKTELEGLKEKLPLYIALKEAQDAVSAKESEIAKLREEALAKILPKAQEVYTKATEEDVKFDSLIDVFNQDPGMPEKGYLVSDANITFVESFKKASMALEKVGDISEPVESNFGYHIIQFASEVPEGPAALETVRETIHASLFSTKREAAYQELQSQWLAAAQIKKYPERMDD